jgi:hypothetical protein
MKLKLSESGQGCAGCIILIALAAIVYLVVYIMWGMLVIGT